MRTVRPVRGEPIRFRRAVSFGDLRAMTTVSTTLQLNPKLQLPVAMSTQRSGRSLEMKNSNKQHVFVGTAASLRLAGLGLGLVVPAQASVSATPMPPASQQPVAQTSHLSHKHGERVGVPDPFEASSDVTIINNSDEPLTLKDSTFTNITVQGIPQTIAAHGSAMIVYSAHTHDAGITPNDNYLLTDSDFGSLTYQTPNGVEFRVELRPAALDTGMGLTGFVDGSPDSFGTKIDSLDPQTNLLELGLYKEFVAPTTK